MSIILPSKKITLSRTLAGRNFVVIDADIGEKMKYGFFKWLFYLLRSTLLLFFFFMPCALTYPNYIKMVENDLDF